MTPTATTVLAAALAGTAPLGALLLGLDRKLTARLQSRVGPPLIQPFYDIAKLLRKQPLLLNRLQPAYVLLHLGLTLATVGILATGGDMLLALFTHAFASISLVLGALCVRSPYSRIGAQRKIMQMLAYEPILLLMVLGIRQVTGSFEASSVIALANQGHNLLLHLPLVFLAFVVVLGIKLEKSPFDVASSHHAHQELVKGVTTEFSGPWLALIEITHCIEVALLFAIVACFWAGNWWIGLGLEAVAFAFLLVLDNAWARLTTAWVVRCLWTIPLALAASNLVAFYL